jgi:hypothetical protein
MDVHKQETQVCIEDTTGTVEARPTTR